MNYELVKKLKDAGFPQPREALDGYYCDFIKGEETRWRGLCSKGTYIPTLLELIEACEKNFIALQQWPGKHLPDLDWWATGKDDIGEHHFDEGGKTPEEAVANLWLALNKKG